LHDAVEIAECGLGLSQDVQAAEPRGVLTLRHIETRAEGACHGDAPVLQGQLTRHVKLAVEVKE